MALTKTDVVRYYVNKKLEVMDAEALVVFILRTNAQQRAELQTYLDQMKQERQAVLATIDQRTTDTKAILTQEVAELTVLTL